MQVPTLFPKQNKHQKKAQYIDSPTVLYTQTYTCLCVSARVYTHACTAACNCMCTAACTVACMFVCSTTTCIGAAVRVQPREIFIRQKYTQMYMCLCTQWYTQRYTRQYTRQYMQGYMLSCIHVLIHASVCTAACNEVQVNQPIVCQFIWFYLMLGSL